jgi:hypothetical protein
MKKSISILILTLFACSTYAQKTIIGIRLSNNITGLPVSTYPSLFYSNFHPGIDFSLKHRINENEKHQWSLSGNVGLFYHHFIQTGIKIYPSIDYALAFNSKWKLNASVDLGYLLAINNVAVLELKDDGNYESNALLKSRSQFMLGWRIGASYTPSGEADGTSYSLAFGTFLQGPYVSGYVPLLPYNSFALGIEIPFNLKKQK